MGKGFFVHKIFKIFMCIPLRLFYSLLTLAEFKEKLPEDKSENVLRDHVSEYEFKSPYCLIT